MAITFKIGISSVDAVQIYPTYEYKPSEEKIDSVHRSRSGSLYQYKWGDYEKWEVPVEYVPNSIAATINSWWNTNTELLFFIVSDSNVEVNSIILRNDKRPLAEFNKPYDVYKKGKIIMETY